MILAGPDKERKVCVFAGFDGREEIVRSGLSRYQVNIRMIITTAHTLGI